MGRLSALPILLSNIVFVVVIIQRFDLVYLLTILLLTIQPLVLVLILFLL